MVAPIRFPVGPAFGTIVLQAVSGIEAHDGHGAIVAVPVTISTGVVVVAVSTSEIHTTTDPDRDAVRVDQSFYSDGRTAERHRLHLPTMPRRSTDAPYTGFSDGHLEWCKMNAGTVEKKTATASRDYSWGW
jgi:hypothetical protein